MRTSGSQKSKRIRLDGEDGFTIVELAIAMSLLALMMVYILPSLNRLTSTLVIAGSETVSQINVARSMDKFEYDIRNMQTLREGRSGINDDVGGLTVGASIGFEVGRNEDTYTSGPIPDNRFDYVCYRWIKPDGGNPGDAGYAKGYVERLVLPYLPKEPVPTPDPDSGWRWDPDNSGCHTLANPESQAYNGNTLGQWERVTGSDVDIRELVFKFCNYKVVAGLVSTTQYDCLHGEASLDDVNVKDLSREERACMFQVGAEVKYFRQTYSFTMGSKNNTGLAPKWKAAWEDKASISAAPRNLIMNDRYNSVMVNPGDPKRTCEEILKP